MKEKILKDLEKIELTAILPVKEGVNLINSNSLSDLKITDDSITLIIDLVPLNIGKKEANILQELLVEKLQKPKFFTKAKKVNVIFTSNQKIKEQSGYSADNKESAVGNLEDNQIPKINFVKNIIAVASGKGGVGKSTIAVNLALSLKRIGFNVGLVDGDVYGPSIPHMMNLSGKPEIKDNLMIPIKSYGISCISVGSLVDKDQALVWRGPMISKTLHQLIRGVNWGFENKEIDYLIIDLPPGTGDIHLSMAKQFPISGAVIVSTPQDISVIDVVKAVDMFKKLNIPIIGLIQNMAYFKEPIKGEKIYLFGEGKAKKFAKDSKIKFLGDVEIDIKIRESGDEGNPLVNQNPSSETAFAFGKIAEKVIDFFAK